MTFFRDCYFWAFLSMFGLVAAGAVVGTKRLGRHALVGVFIVTLFVVGRVILALPVCDQPRFSATVWTNSAGWLLFIAGLIFFVPGLQIKAFTSPDEKVTLQTGGFYAICRNPIYLGEVLWCFGWAVLFRSTIGVLLVPFWWASLLFHIALEEESLERELGEPYLEYKRRVKGRILPGLPF